MHLPTSFGAHSKLYRNYQNLLFVANYLDRQIRKDNANHVRQTIQFAQCPQAMMAKLLCISLAGQRVETGGQAISGADDGEE